MTGANETAFYAPQIPCGSIPNFEKELGAPTAATATLGPSSDACNVWFGAGLGEDPTNDGTSGVTALHYDHSHNVYAQHVGKKRFTLVPPHARAALAPVRNMAGVVVSETRANYYGYVDKTPIQPPRLFTLKGGARFTALGGRQTFSEKPLHVYHNFGKSSARDKAKKVGPKFLAKHAITVDLEPGDVLYIPPFWYHEVASSGRPRGTLFLVCRGVRVRSPRDLDAAAPPPRSGAGLIATPRRRRDAPRGHV